MSSSFIFIDASYFTFFRYHALQNWWKLVKKDESQDFSISNTAFVAKFKQLFVSKFKEIFKKLKIILQPQNIHWKRLFSK